MGLQRLIGACSADDVIEPERTATMHSANMARMIVPSTMRVANKPTHVLSYSHNKIRRAHTHTLGEGGYDLTLVFEGRSARVWSNLSRFIRYNATQVTLNHIHSRKGVHHG